MSQNEATTTRLPDSPVSIYERFTSLYDLMFRFNGYARSIERYLRDNPLPLAAGARVRVRRALLGFSVRESGGVRHSVRLRVRVRAVRARHQHDGDDDGDEYDADDDEWEVAFRSFGV